MRKITILFSISLGTLVYVLVSLFCGQNGLWAESQLVSQKMDLCTNIAKIQKAVADYFNITVDNLKSKKKHYIVFSIRYIHL